MESGAACIMALRNPARRAARRLLLPHSDAPPQDGRRLISAQTGNGAIITPMRRFPPPWSIEEHAESFVVRDATGQALGIAVHDQGSSAHQAPCYG
jgi:hypothetical protein